VQKEILEKINSSQLAIFLVWTPVQPQDNRAAADEARSLLPDARVLHYWDNNRMLSQNYRRVLPLAADCRTAWDVYLLYNRGVKWGEFIPPVPSFWMHQLSCITKERYLDVNVLRAAVAKTL
jgi:hypothetical protein